MLALSRVRRPAMRSLGHLFLGCGLLLGGYLIFTRNISIASPELPGGGSEALAGEPAAAPEPLATPDLAAEREALQSEPALEAALTSGQLSIGLEPGSTQPAFDRWASEGFKGREAAMLPILMYHHINVVPAGSTDLILKDLTVSPLNFRRQLEYLEASMAKSVSLANLMSFLQGGDRLPDRAVVLTFDDGYEDSYRLAYPLLRQFGMTGTFFVVANLVGQPGYMTWDQLREMQIHGMDVESHSLDHIDLAVLPRAELQRQLTESRRILELNLMRPVRYLNYPSGRYTPHVIASAREAGYDAAVTVNYSLIQRRAAPYELNRVRVKGADTLELLATKVAPNGWRPFVGPFGR